MRRGNSSFFIQKGSDKKWTTSTHGAILRRIVDRALESRAVVVGHLSITVPAIAVIVLAPLLGLRMFGPYLVVYYFMAGMAIAWQWHSVALPHWKVWLARKNVPDEEVVSLARRTGLAWPQESVIGPFTVHTAAAALCGIQLGPWLLSLWLRWIPPLAGMATRRPTGDDYLQHFELASIVPALVVGYIASRYFPKLGTLAWIVPSMVLAYKLLTFTEPSSSILAPQPSTRFSYFFAIQRYMPTFTHSALVGDFIRVAQQMFVVAPFYAGLAYSVGALAAKHDILKKLIGRSRSVQTESEIVDGEHF